MTTRGECRVTLLFPLVLAVISSINAIGWIFITRNRTEAPDIQLLREGACPPISSSIYGAIIRPATSLYVLASKNKRPRTCTVLPLVIVVMPHSSVPAF